MQFAACPSPVPAAAVGRAEAASVLLLLERNSCSAATAVLPVPGLKLGEKLCDFRKAASTSFHTSRMASCITWCKFSLRVKPVIHSIFSSEEQVLFGTLKITCSTQKIMVGHVLVELCLVHEHLISPDVESHVAAPQEDEGCVGEVCYKLSFAC